MDKAQFEAKREETVNRLNQLIEQAQVKAGLLKLETREAWGHLETGLTKIKNILVKDLQEAKTEIDEAQVQAHLGMMEAREEWKELKDYLSQAISSVNAQGTLDEMKLQAHLAQMEASDRFAEQRKAWTEFYEKDVKNQLSESMDEMNKEMETFAQSMVD